MPDGRLERTRRAYRLDFEPEQAGVLVEYLRYNPDGTPCPESRMWPKALFEGATFDIGKCMTCEIPHEMDEPECPAYG